MRKFFLMGVLLLCTLSSYAQGGVRIYVNSSKSQAYQGVYLRKAYVPDIFPKSYMVWLSEEPDGVESGYYGVQTGNGFLYNGSKEKIKLDKMEDAGNGWYYFAFGKDLYIRRVEPESHLDNIRLVPSGTEKPSSSESSAETTASTAAANQEKNYITPLDISKLKKPAFAENGWSLAETTKEKDGATCKRYVKEINDDDFSVRFFEYPNGDFFTDSINYYMGDFMITNKNGFKVIRSSGHTYWLFPNGNYTYEDNEFKRETQIFVDSYSYDWDENDIRVYTRYPYRDKRKDEENCKYIDGGIIYRDSQFEGNRLVIKQSIHPEWVNDNGSNTICAYPQEEPYDIFNRFRTKGFIIGDRLCGLDIKGNVLPMMQRIKDCWTYANGNDTVVNVKDSISGNSKFYVFSYKNGDRIKVGDYTVGSIHRNGGILKFRKSDPPILTMPDGKTITYKKFGSGLDQDNSYLGGTMMLGWGLNYYAVLRNDSILLCDGTVTYPDGRIEEYTDGFPESYWIPLREAEKKAKAAEEKAKAAAEKAKLAKERAQFIQKWRFYPGDYRTEAKWSQCIIPGRPFGAIEAYFKTALIRDEGTSKYYKVFTTGYVDKVGGLYSSKDAYVWVRNGKITSVSWY